MATTPKRLLFVSTLLIGLGVIGNACKQKESDPGPDLASKIIGPWEIWDLSIDSKPQSVIGNTFYRNALQFNRISGENNQTVGMSLSYYGISGQATTYNETVTLTEVQNLSLGYAVLNLKGSNTNASEYGNRSSNVLFQNIQVSVVKNGSTIRVIAKRN